MHGFMREGGCKAVLTLPIYFSLAAAASRPPVSSSRLGARSVQAAAITEDTASAAARHGVKERSIRPSC